MKKTGQIFLVVGVIMFIMAVIFVGYALNHPEATSPFSNPMLTYVIIMIVVFIVSAIILTISKKNT